jgi:hypothetical protein
MGFDLGNSAVLAAVIAALGAVTAAGLALISALVVNAITKRMKDRELFQHALQHLTGQTQNRSVGIAIIKDYAEKTDIKNVAATIFIAQMLHLYDKGYGRDETAASNGTSHTGDRKIEEFNFEVMKDAVRTWGVPSLGDRAAQVAKSLKLDVFT